MDGLLSRGTWGVVTSYRQQTDTDTSLTDVTQADCILLYSGGRHVLEMFLEVNRKELGLFCS